MKAKVAVSSIALVGAVVLSSCSTHREMTVNQLPSHVRSAALSEARGGYIEDIEQNSDKGMIYYKVEYERAGEDFVVFIDDHGEKFAMGED